MIYGNKDDDDKNGWQQRFYLLVSVHPEQP
jgi:hypothetical protein